MKALAPLPSWVKWSFILPLIVLNGWAVLILFSYFRPIVILLVTATLLAFVLNYPVAFLQRWRIARGYAVLVVLGGAIALLFLLGITLLPILIEQLSELANRLPSWLTSGNQQWQNLQVWAAAHHVPINTSSLTAQLEEKLSTQLQTVSGTVLNVLLTMIGSALELVLTIVLTFYLLLHGERLWNDLFEGFSLDPKRYIRHTIRQNFQNYYIGQATVAVLMGTALSLAFILMHLPFSLLFGLGVGVMALFPFGAPVGILLVGLLAAVKSIWLGIRILIVATIIEQMIENGIAPLLIGGFVGLNPIWILLSLLVGAKLGGFLGLILAVPLATSIKSLLDRRQFPSSGQKNAPPPYSVM